ncbi:TetR/AcrR family transcriptional regulator [Agromyces intestinalis]|uniref:TetR/AcrR family transcriptional regulator n=1 Tax=Agromyces intestinalis TaxID=2592652 RepID=A0A5C1YF44_9MICO|nr:TetR family transcriptional regulator [Agromyces intestinalis]QEO14070.1 TetR/AcrR family transcriptional regulator [Agromyces intestinalis]
MIGRRRGASTTREDLIAAARVEFAEHGIDGATTRRIAARAGVDPAMIAHHFGSKDGLWQAVLDLPLDPVQVIAPLRDVPPDEAGRALLATLLATWDSPKGTALLAVLRSALRNPAFAAQAREFVVHRAILPFARRVAPEPDAARAAERASLVASQIGGLVLARYVLRIEPLASADHAWVIDRIGPTLQHYLTGPLPD